MPAFAEGKAARRFWDSHRGALIETLGLDAKTAARWEKTPKSPNAARTLAAEMVGVFLASLPKRCFVITPFAEDFTPLYDEVIEPAVRRHGDQPIRLDRYDRPGDVSQQIDEGIARADYVICVLDGMRPNVMYELGMAHALSKPTILLWNRPKGARAPFDLAVDQRIDFSTVGPSLKNRVARAVGHIR